MVIVQHSSKVRKRSEDVETNELKPHQDSSKDAPYITAYFEAAKLPTTLVIGDGKWYNSTSKSYWNKPLEQNSSYFVFLRFFESKQVSLQHIILAP